MNSSHFRRDDVRMAETCRNFIEGENPFFLYWCSHNPHRAKRIDDPLPFSFAADLWRSSTWQAALRADLEAFGCRSTSDYLHRPRLELYDLQNDPNESNNVAGNPDQVKLVERFCEKLHNFEKETGDVWLSNWEYE